MVAISLTCFWKLPLIEIPQYSKTIFTICTDQKFVLMPKLYLTFYNLGAVLLVLATWTWKSAFVSNLSYILGLKNFCVTNFSRFFFSYILAQS